MRRIETLDGWLFTRDDGEQRLFTHLELIESALAWEGGEIIDWEPAPPRLMAVGFDWLPVYTPVRWYPAVVAEWLGVVPQDGREGA